MNIRLLRNATMRLAYAGRILLADPDLAPRHARSSFTGRSRNPMVALPVEAAAILAGVEAALVSHLHADHFDAEAQRLLPRDLPLFCQPADAETLRGYGFGNVNPVDDTVEWNGIAITRVAGQHGFGADWPTWGRFPASSWRRPASRRCTGPVTACGTRRWRPRSSGSGRR